MTISNIQSSYRKCEIYPFDNSVIADHAFAPNDVTHIAVSDESQQEVPSQLLPSAQEMLNMQEPSIN